MEVNILLNVYSQGGTWCHDLYLCVLKISIYIFGFKPEVGMVCIGCLGFFPPPWTICLGNTRKQSKKKKHPGLLEKMIKTISFYLYLFYIMINTLFNAWTTPCGTFQKAFYIPSKCDCVSNLTMFQSSDLFRKSRNSWQQQLVICNKILLHTCPFWGLLHSRKIKNIRWRHHQNLL